MPLRKRSGGHERIKVSGLGIARLGLIEPDFRRFEVSATAETCEVRTPLNGYVYFEVLQIYHISWYVIGLPRVMGQRWLPWYGKEISRILFNRLTLSPVTFLCRLGLRHWLPGHTLLVVLKRKGH